MLLPERKKSDELLPAFLATTIPTTREITKKAITEIQSTASSRIYVYLLIIFY
jgi:hypothetical protein